MTAGHLTAVSSVRRTGGPLLGRLRQERRRCPAQDALASGRIIEVCSLPLALAIMTAPRQLTQRPSPRCASARAALFEDDIRGYPFRSYQYALRLGYDGSEFNGWQAQRHTNQKIVPTVQQVLEEGLECVLDQDADTIFLKGASRTDAGVHARGQIATFFSRRRLNTDVLIRAINSRIPNSIRVFSAWMVNPDFHPLIHISSKTYEYKICTCRIPHPIYRFDRMHVPALQNITRMRDAAALLRGTHDFIHFSSLKSVVLADEKKSSVKSVEYIDIHEIEDGFKFTIKGSGFLYHQIRHMVGAIIAVGRSRIEPGYLQEILDPGDRFEHHSPRWTMCEAKGLCLANVEIMKKLPQPSELIHPELEHDIDGRVCGGHKK